MRPFHYVLSIVLLIMLITGCSYVAELITGKSEALLSYQFPTPTPTYANAEGDIDFDIEFEIPNAVVSYFTSNIGKQISYFVIKPHKGPIVYKIAFQNWPYPADISVKTDKERLLVDYKRKDEENANDENFIVSFVYDKEIYIDGLVLSVEGVKYDNKNIKTIIGME